MARQRRRRSTDRRGTRGGIIPARGASGAAAARREAYAGPNAVVCLECGHRFRGVSWKHLRRVHDYEGDHPIEDYKARYGLTVATSRATRNLGRRARERWWAAQGKRWPRSRVIAEIRRRRAHGLPLSGPRVPVPLRNAAARRFGNLRAALRRAGMDPAAAGMRSSPWTREAVIGRIRALARRGEPLAWSEVYRKESGLPQAAAKFIPGGWRAAVHAAGLDPATHRKAARRWTDEAMRDWVLGHSRRGVAPRATEAPAGLLGAVYKHARTGWQAYVEHLGLRYPTPPKSRWNRRSVRVAISELRRTGQPLNASAVKSRRATLVEAARRVYGDWDAALRAAGVDPETVRGWRAWTRAAVVAEIRNLHAAGERLDDHYIRRHHRRLHHAAIRRFPSAWGKALRAAGLDPSTHRAPTTGWTLERAAGWVRQQCRAKRSVVARDVPRDLYWFVIRQGVGGWPAFVESTGIPYPWPLRPPRPWSRRVVVDEIGARHRRGQSLRPKVVTREDQSLYIHARRLFGTWRRALDAALGARAAARIGVRRRA